MTIALWSSDAWRQEAVAWLDERLAADGTRRVGEVTQPHLRPWATVLRAPTTRGVVWLKAAGPETAFEVELYGLLERVVPERILVPVARDAERGWMVLPDGGVRLGNGWTRSTWSRPWSRCCPGTGSSSGTSGRTPTSCRGSGSPTCGRRSCRRGSRRRWRRSGATSGGTGPRPRRGGRAGAVLRLGDSVVAHPFASMLLGLGMIRLQLEVAADDPAVTRPRDAYLEVFGDLASHAELVEELACRVGKVGRALSWDRAVRLQGEEAGEFADAPLRALESLLSDSAIVAV